jgi:hypothetical protein
MMFFSHLRSASLLSDNTWFNSLALLGARPTPPTVRLVGFVMETPVFAEGMCADPFQIVIVIPSAT